MVNDLIKRLEAGETGKALDREIARLAGWHRVEPRYTRGKHGGWIAPDDFIGRYSDGSPILDGLHGTDIHRDVPNFSTSLDAADLLHWKMVPLWRVYTVSDERLVNQVSERQGFVCGMDSFEPELSSDERAVVGYAPTEAAARLVAVLKAWSVR